MKTPMQQRDYAPQWLERRRYPVGWSLLFVAVCIGCAVVFLGAFGGKV